MFRPLMIQGVSTLEQGAELAVWVGPVLHRGIFTGRYDSEFRPIVISNSLKRGGVFKETFDEFSGGKRVTNYGVRGNLPGWMVVQNAYARLDEPYDLLRNNCEHFVRSCQGLQPRSPQVAIAFGALLAGSALLLARAE